MRIALVAPDSRGWRVDGGAREGERLRALAERLGDRGHNVTVFCTQFWDGYDETLRIEGVTYHAVTVAPARTSFATRIGPLVARLGPDVVHARPASPGVVFGARTGSRLARCPFVVEWTGEEDVAAHDSVTGRRAARTPDHVVSPSALVETRVRELGVPDDRTVQIPHGIDTGRIRATDPGDGADVVYAGPLDEFANLEDLLLALAELRQRGWSAQVIGDGPAREEYEQQARELRIHDRIEFVGDCSRAERIARYRASHAFVQTREREPFAHELLWAMACGCVGIVEYQADSSAHELVVGKPRGFRVTEPEEIDEALREAADLGRRSDDEAFEPYDHAAVTDRYLRLYGADASGGEAGPAGVVADGRAPEPEPEPESEIETETEPQPGRPDRSDERA